MKLSQLRRRHPEYDGDTLQTHGDLFAGGAQFRKNVSRYLPQHRPVETNETYKARCASATYLNYVAPIVNFFASWLFTSPLTIKGEREAGGDPEKFYAAFKEDCDGKGTDLDAFLRARFVDACVAQRAYWRVEFPDPGAPLPEGAVRADWEREGLDRARLVPVPAANIVHWKRDCQGAFEWVVEYEKRCELVDWTDAAERVFETWTQWHADGTARRWEISYAKGEAPAEDDEVLEVEPPYNPCGRLPLVELSLPRELWILNLLADPQLEIFRKRAGLSWAIDRVCYAMPIIFGKKTSRPAAMGAGYYLQLGEKERFEYGAPPSGPFATIETNIEKLKDEAFRVAHQMAQGVSNNAAAVGRSADSKSEDGHATEIVLQAYGARVREPVELTHELLSAGREEDVEWDVSGMSVYRVQDAGTIAEQALTIDPLRIPSQTFRTEQLTRVALSQLPDADEATRQKIRKEIEKGVRAEDTLREQMAAAMPPLGEQQQQQPPGTQQPPGGVGAEKQPPGAPAPAAAAT